MKNYTTLLNKRTMLNLGITLVGVICFYAIYIVGMYLTGMMATLNAINGYGISNTTFGLVVDAFIVIGVITSNIVYSKLKNTK